MTKEQFLAMSLPYKLHVIDLEISEVFEVTGYRKDEEELLIHDNIDGSVESYCSNLLKPILHHLSDLTKEIEHKGEKFVPIVELAKMSYPNHEWKLSSSGLYACVGNGYMTFEYDYGYNCFLCNNSAQLDQLECLFKAIEWHFDIFGGIDNGEAIDVNILDKNPYA